MINSKKVIKSSVIRTFLFILFFPILQSQAQVKVSGIEVPSIYKIQEGNLVLNGAGTREKYWMDLYVGALYLKTKNSDAQKIIDADESMVVKLYIISDLITSEKMNAAMDEGFKKSAGASVSTLQLKINQFKAAFAEKIKKGDEFEIIYDANKGMQVFKNKKLCAAISGLEFKKALFGIWLCSQPADENLKNKLLGK